MQKIQVLVFIVFLLFSWCTLKDPKPRDYSEWENFEEEVSNLKTAKAISEYMLQNLHYTSREKGERAESSKHGYSWKRPADTFVDKYGFSYDLSAFALFALLKNGYSEAKLMFVCWGDWGNNSSTGHLVSFFKEGEKYYIINNGIFQGPFNSIDQVKQITASGREIIHTRTFRFNEIPFGIEYSKMDYFCGNQEIELNQ